MPKKYKQKKTYIVKLLELYIFSLPPKSERIKKRKDRIIDCNKFFKNKVKFTNNLIKIMKNGKKDDKFYL